MASLFAFLHFSAAFALFAALAAELVVTRNAIDATTARRLLVLDLVFGISAGVVLLAGAMRAMYFEKGPDYYLHSVPFIAKLCLFALIVLLSIYPTTRFMAWSRQLKQGIEPLADAAMLRRIRLTLHLEATLFMLLLLCASLMAHGVGMFGRW